MIDHAPTTRPLIIGGGFIGFHLAQRMANEDRSVTVLSRSFAPVFERNLTPKIKPVVGVTSQESQLRELVSQSDLVVVCASGSTPQTAVHDPAGSLLSATSPILEVLRAMVLEENRRVAVLSSGGTVYGVPSETPTSEQAAIEPCTEHGFNYSVVEQAVQLFHRMHGLEYQIFRLANVYGPGERTRGAQGVIAHWLQAAADGRPLRLIGDANVERDFIFVEDACAAIDRALAHGQWPAIYNVGSGKSESLGDLLDNVVSLVGGCEIERVPGREGDLPLTMLATDRLRADTMWSPKISLEEGLRRTWSALLEAHEADQSQSSIAGADQSISATYV